MVIRHHTNGNAGKVMAFPRIAVNPQRKTQKWICSHARSESDIDALAFFIDPIVAKKREN
jgi:hypothetical protein